jgi:cell division transport system ATP-binding protein
LLQDINAAGTTIIMATHDPDIVKKLSKRVLSLDKGKLVKDEKSLGHKKEE